MHKQMWPNTTALLPIRAGSKGLGNKNTRQLAGKPLYRHTVDQAIRTVGNCIVSTDIEEVIDAPVPSGCQVLSRPADLGRDDTPMADVLMQLLPLIGGSQHRAETAVLLQATSPLRSDEDVSTALDLYSSGNYDLVMSVTAADKSIWKHGVIQDNRFSAISNPSYCFTNRQDLPEAVKPNGAVYVFSVQKFLEIGQFPTQNIGAFEMPAIRSIDIDNQGDLEAAEVLLSQNSNGSQFRRAG